MNWLLYKNIREYESNDPYCGEKIQYLVIHQKRVAYGNWRYTESCSARDMNEKWLAGARNHPDGFFVVDRERVVPLNSNEGRLLKMKLVAEGHDI